MRKSLLLAAGFITLTSFAGLAIEGPQKGQLMSFDPQNLNISTPLDLKKVSGASPVRKASRNEMRRVGEAAAEYDMYVAAQKFHSNYTFYY